MAEVTVLHNPRCSASRAALEAAEQLGVEVDVVPYLKQPLTEADLLDLLAQLEGEPGDLVRRDATFKALGLGDDDVNTPAEVARLLAERPALMQRPVLVRGDHAIIGRPKDAVPTFLRAWRVPFRPQKGPHEDIANIIWFVFAGLWLWLSYMLAGLIMCVLIVTIPFGVASFRIANFAAWPFGRTYVDKPTAGVGSLIGNIIWFVLAGLWIALAHIGTAIALAVTIIGLPMAWANLKMIPLALFPLGKEIVPENAVRAGTHGGSAPSPTMSRY